MNEVNERHERLVRRLRTHYRNLAPHVKERASARLLLEAIEHIESLHESIDAMPTTKIACDGVLMVPIDRYNKAVEIANA